MIIIMLSGGLGNQMFQYALYCRLQELGRVVKMDEDNGFIDDPNGRRPVLKEVFGIEYEVASKKEIRDLLDSHKDPFSIARRKLFGRKSKNYQEKDGNFDEYVLKNDDLYLDGYWQTQKYFDTPGVLERLKKEYVLNPNILITKEDTKKLLEDIENCNSVSIHVRRGDYLNPNTSKTHGGICTDDYYKNAMGISSKEIPGAKFYIFSNDEKWLRENVHEDNQIPVCINEKQQDIAEMLLMSKCRHHIMANSSYSWWACWMNDEPSKKIYAPSKWINNKKMDDIYTERMICI